MAKWENYYWLNVQEFSGRSYTCGYCDNKVGPHKGYRALMQSTGFEMAIYICTECNNPTYFDGINEQYPKPRAGEVVQYITDTNVEAAYNEARDCMSVGAYTAATLLCRKILMNFAVGEGAEKGRSFEFYVNFISDNHYVPPKGKAWIEPIRKKGNEATHEIPQIKKVDAERILHFTMMLLKTNYELAAMAEEHSANESAKTLKPTDR